MGTSLREGLKTKCTSLTVVFLSLGCGHALTRPTQTPVSAESQDFSIQTSPDEKSSEDPGSEITENRFNFREPSSVPQLIWPVANPKISQKFKSEDSRRPHDGIDLSAPKGTRIYAPADGKVVYAGHKFHGYGKMIVIEHGSKLATIFGHCQKLFVKAGEIVRRGSLIGLIGRTGRATGSHLHFEVRLNRIPVDPLNFMPLRGL